MELQYCDPTVLAVPFTSKVPTPVLSHQARETWFARRRIDTLTSRTLLKYCLSVLLSLGIALTGSLFAFAEIQKLGPLPKPKVHAITIRPEWNQFRILVWQYKTSVLKDIDLYRRAGLGGFHIDRGAGKDKIVEFSMKEHFPYYVDHVADKGFLYLTGNNVKEVSGKRDLVTRPHSLADPETIVQIKQHIARNIAATQNGHVLAYAFDDDANSIDPRIPAGFVGGQGPGPWGGYDYAMLSRSE